MFLVTVVVNLYEYTSVINLLTYAYLKGLRGSQDVVPLQSQVTRQQRLSSEEPISGHKMLTSECTQKNIYAILMNKSQNYIIRGDVRGRSNTSVLFSCSIRKLIDLFLKVHKDYAWHFHYKVEQRCFVQSVNYCNPMWTKSFEFKKSALSLKSETYLPKSYRLFSAQFS